MGESFLVLLQQCRGFAQPRNASRCWIAALVLLLLLLLSLLMPADATAEQVREWKLADRSLHERTTTALSRYFMFVRADSLRLRYLRNNSPQMQYRLRGRVGASDSLGQIISISLGQLILYPATSVRVALGEELYGALVASRGDAASEERTVIEWDNFGHDYWDNSNSVILSIDRADWRITPMLGLFAQIGAPESNLHWWSDGTWRAGINTPTWELAVLLPNAAGAAGIGPLRERLLAPGYGASAMVRGGPVTGRARFTSIGDPAFDALNVTGAVYVHTLSGQVTYSEVRETFLGTIRGDIGVGYEEFTLALRENGALKTDSLFARFAPIIDLTLISAQQNMRFSIGWGDLSLRAAFSARLTEILWVEARIVGTSVLRERRPFEHPAYLFITPRIRF